MHSSYAHTYDHPADVLRFVAGQDSSALILITDISGGTMRSAGSLMAVTPDGQVAGYVSNGCVDADIIFQAKQALETNKPRHLTYGEGSSFMDISLPCGGRIDLCVIPNPDKALIAQLSQALYKRQAAELKISKLGFSSSTYAKTYTPKLRLRIAGRGEAVKTLAGQAQTSGFEVDVWSPDVDILQGQDFTRFTHLTDPANIPPAQDDKWTAVIVLFHDHDWEPHILKQSLEGDAFYVGALGSKRTHGLRTATLANMGVDKTLITRIHAPIGLIPSMRDANLLTLSTLAQVVSEAQRLGRI